MGEACKDCGKWEEDMYWNHFQTMHFCQFLSKGFNQKLTIPKKFANNLKEKLRQTVALKGPSGTTWNVGLTTSGDALFFKHGWKEFIKDHSLEENDFLIFRYNGDSRFDVLMFDQESLCEKEASYFVRKCVHTKLDGGCWTKRKIRESSVEDIHASSHDIVGCTSSKKPRKDDNVIAAVSSGQSLVSRANRRIQKEAHCIKPVDTKWRLRSRKPSICAEGVKAKPDAEQKSINGNGAYYLQYVSNRRPVTEEEKEKALQLATHAASNKESFVVVMRPTHVYKRYYMAIPAEWVTSYLPPQSQDVIIRVKENTWRIKYWYKVSGGGGFTSGWKNFAVENNLEEFDVCLFELASHMNDTIVMDVSIFRVVQEVIPPTQVTSASYGRSSKNVRRKFCKGFRA